MHEQSTIQHHACEGWEKKRNKEKKERRKKKDSFGLSLCLFLFLNLVNPLMPRLNTVAQVCLPRFFSGHLIFKACS
jgi:hypothetical protein